MPRLGNGVFLPQLSSTSHPNAFRQAAKSQALNILGQAPDRVRRAKDL